MTGIIEVSGQELARMIMGGERGFDNVEVYHGTKVCAEGLSDYMSAMSDDNPLLFRGATMNGVNFGGLRFGPTYFSNASLVSANFPNCVLDRVVFHGSNLRGSNFGGANIGGGVFTDAILDGTNFEGVKGLDKASGLNYAYWRGVRISRGDKKVVGRILAGAPRPFVVKRGRR